MPYLASQAHTCKSITSAIAVSATAVAMTLAQCGLYPIQEISLTSNAFIAHPVCPVRSQIHQVAHISSPLCSQLPNPEHTAKRKLTGGCPVNVDAAGLAVNCLAKILVMIYLIRNAEIMTYLCIAKVVHCGNQSLTCLQNKGISEERH